MCVYSLSVRCVCGWLCVYSLSVPSPTLSPTDPVPRGLLTLCPAASSGPQGLYTAYIDMAFAIYGLNAAHSRLQSEDAVTMGVSRPRGTGSVGDSVGEGWPSAHSPHPLPPPLPPRAHTRLSPVWCKPQHRYTTSLPRSRGLV